jgi:hypothetical protein
MSYLKKIFQHHKLINPLKRGGFVKTSPNHKLIIPLTRNRPKQPDLIEPNLWAKFDSDTFDGIHLLGYLAKNEKQIPSVNCSFTISSISNDGTWTETPIVTVFGTQAGNVFKAIVSQAVLNPIELDSEVTLSILMSLDSVGIKYNKKIYINHLGVYDSIFRLRQDVEFLDISKVDE